MYLAGTKSWYLERVIFLIGGSVILVSIVLAWYFGPYWLILTGLVGINLVIFAVTGFCLIANVLYALGIKPK